MEEAPRAQSPDNQPQLQQNIGGQGHKVMGGIDIYGPAVLQQSEVSMVRIEDTAL